MTTLHSDSYRQTDSHYIGILFALFSKVKYMLCHLCVEYVNEIDIEIVACLFMPSHSPGRQTVVHLILTAVPPTSNIFKGH